FHGHPTLAHRRTLRGAHSWAEGRTEVARGDVLPRTTHSLEFPISSICRRKRARHPCAWNRIAPLPSDLLRVRQVGHGTEARLGLDQRSPLEAGEHPLPSTSSTHPRNARTSS